MIKPTDVFPAACLPACSIFKVVVSPIVTRFQSASEKELLKLGQDLIYSSKTENLAGFKLRSEVLHSHREANPWGQQITQAPNTAPFISSDQRQPNEVDNQHLERKEKNHFQKPAS